MTHGALAAFEARQPGSQNQKVCILPAVLSQKEGFFGFLGLSVLGNKSMVLYIVVVIIYTVVFA